MPRLKCWSYTSTSSDVFMAWRDKFTFILHESTHVLEQSTVLLRTDFCLYFSSVDFWGWFTLGSSVTLLSCINHRSDVALKEVLKQGYISDKLDEDGRKPLWSILRSAPGFVWGLRKFMKSRSRVGRPWSEIRNLASWKRIVWVIALSNRCIRFISNAGFENSLV
jgi:hypothetical protein